MKPALRRFLSRALLPGPATAAALAAFIAFLRQPNNPDTLWHLALGRWIVTHGAIPDISQFYYSATSGYGYDYSWLSQLVLFGVYRVLGGAGIAILNAALAGFTFYFLYKLLEGGSRNLLVNFFILGLALVTLTTYLSGRPVIFTIAFFALELSMLADCAQGRLRPRIWLLVPLTALWANLHPGFLLGPLALLLFLPLVRAGRARWSLAGVAVASTAAVMFNPYGARMYLLPWETLRALPMLRGLTEWTGVAGGEAVVWGGFVALVAVGMASRRQPVPIVALTVLAALASGVSDRNLPLFGLVTVFVLSRTLLPLLRPVFNRVAWIRRFDMSPGAEHERWMLSSMGSDDAGELGDPGLAAVTQSVNRRPAGSAREAATSVAGGWVWLLLVPLFVAGAAGLRLASLNLDFNFSGYPVAALNHIEKTGLRGRTFVRETWSGYVLWARPGARLFYDAKGGFSRSAVADHCELVRPRPGWRDVAERDSLSVFLLERGSPLSVVLGEAAGWHRAYSDTLAEVFVRDTARGRPRGAVASLRDLPGLRFKYPVAFRE
jgi:hypothetical protein